MYVRLVCWTTNGKLPESRYVLGKPKVNLKLSTTEWASSVLGGEQETKLDVWTPSEGDWDPARLKSLTIDIAEDVPAVLFRLSGVTNCVGLGREIALVEAALCKNDPLTKIELETGNVDNVLRVLDVYAWNENPTNPPKRFRINVVDDVIKLEHHSALIDFCAKKVDVKGDARHAVERWDPSTCGWKLFHVDEPFTVLDEHIQSVLIRNSGNRAPIGLGKCIDLVEDEMSSSVSTSSFRTPGRPAVSATPSTSKRKRGIELSPVRPKKRVLNKGQENIEALAKAKNVEITDLTNED